MTRSTVQIRERVAQWNAMVGMAMIGRVEILMTGMIVIAVATSTMTHLIGNAGTANTRRLVSRFMSMGYPVTDRNVFRNQAATQGQAFVARRIVPRGPRDNWIARIRVRRNGPMCGLPNDLSIPQSRYHRGLLGIEARKGSG